MSGTSTGIFTSIIDVIILISWQLDLSKLLPSALLAFAIMIGNKLPCTIYWREKLKKRPLAKSFFKSFYFTTAVDVITSTAFLAAISCLSMSAGKSFSTCSLGML